MGSTLKGNLEELELKVNMLKKDFPSLAPTELVERILVEFYKTDSLAYAVAIGSDSYIERIRAIEQRYSSFWSKISAPTEDNNFDQEVREVLGSMNHVGLYYFSPELFTTEGRRKEVRLLDRRYLAFSSLLTVATVALTYITFKYFSAPHAALLVMAIPACCLVFKALYHNPAMKERLDNLRTAAHETDTLLRQYKIKLSN